MKKVNEIEGYAEYLDEDDPRPLYAPIRWQPERSPSGWWRMCETCGELFPMNRSHRKYCSNACRQQAYRYRMQRDRRRAGY
jgi:hypothetical protein